jgi:hypothetical protein
MGVDTPVHHDSAALAAMGGKLHRGTPGRKKPLPHCGSYILYQD